MERRLAPGGTVGRKANGCTHSHADLVKRLPDGPPVAGASSDLVSAAAASLLGHSKRFEYSYCPPIVQPFQCENRSFIEKQPSGTAEVLLKTRCGSLVSRSRRAALPTPSERLSRVRSSSRRPGR